jgi:hypothetical protein
MTGTTNHITKVLYIAGPGRSGSTILGNILGQIESFFLVGELRYLADRGLVENRMCSCGLPFKTCPMWSDVLAHAFGDTDPTTAAHLLDDRKHGLTNRQLLVTPPNKRQQKLARSGTYLSMLERLYRSVQSVSDSKVIVDTSKSPAYGYTLEHLGGIELYVVHLVRDPRAVAYSWWSRKKRQPASEKKPTRNMTAQNPISSSIVWSASNSLVESIWSNSDERYMFLRYEDFIADPRNAVSEILEFVGEEHVKLPFSGERDVVLGTTHTFSGNPNRLQHGLVQLRTDDEWRYKMSSIQKSIVALITWPGLRKYRYGRSR